MKTGEDREAKNMIHHFIEVMKDKYIPITCEAVIMHAEKDPDLKKKPEDLTRVKLELIEMYKAGEIKRAQPIKKV